MSLSYTRRVFQVADNKALSQTHPTLEAHTGFHLLASPHPTASTTVSTLVPQATYDGGYADPAAKPLLRVANGGAGQSGLIGALANAFIKYQVEKNKMSPFLVCSD